MSVIVETEWTRMLPSMDYLFYDRPVALYADGEGFIVAGHDRRSLAAVNRTCPEQDMPRTGAARNVPVKARWYLIHETCGCTPEQHAEHGDDCYDHCVEFRNGLPPCNELYGWMVEAVDPSTPGAVPVLEVHW